jgi:predicted lipid-binding transport protein (Tim44 family)
MKNWMIGALVLALVAATVPTATEAKRLGGGKSTGMQRDMPARTAPDAPAGKPASPSPQQAAPATAGAAPAAAAPKRNWMGPLAGLAAGLGIAALMSHFGMGEAMGNFLMLALLAVAGVFVVGFLMRKFGPGRATAAAAAGNGSTSRTQVAWPQAAQPESAPAAARTALADAPSTSTASATPGASADLPATQATQVAAAPSAAATVARAFVPAAFDTDGFTRTAKMIFIRLQAANDTADLDDLRRFTTPELFAAIRLEIQERGATPQTTDVLKVDAEVLDVANEDGRQVVSVRFKGQVVEEKGAAATDINEVWHLVKPLDDSRPWAIAGIEQAH